MTSCPESSRAREKKRHTHTHADGRKRRGTGKKDRKDPCRWQWRGSLLFQTDAQGSDHRHQHRQQKQFFRSFFCSFFLSPPYPPPPSSSSTTLLFVSRLFHIQTHSNQIHAVLFLSFFLPVSLFSSPIHPHPSPFSIPISPSWPNSQSCPSLEPSLKSLHGKSSCPSFLLVLLSCGTWVTASQEQRSYLAGLRVAGSERHHSQPCIRAVRPLMPLVRSN